MNNLLQVRDLHASYAKGQVLRGVNFDLNSSEVVALLGRNGAGRSTCLKAIMGMVEMKGSIQYQSASLVGLPSYAIAQAGIAYVPEDRAIFAKLSVEQNLLLGLKPAHSVSSNTTTQWQLHDAYALFPVLKQRRHVAAGALSGGEQQMLSLARSLLGNPDLLLVDEPTEGLAPQVVKQLLHCFQTIKQRGVAILLVEQKLQLAMQLADRFLLLGHGQIVFDGSREELLDNELLRKEWLEV
ncbi:ABC transporter ATP-binding protein [Undibacterium seohonense]|uniref:ABC transporter ATP-binding protein n=1 Tax=Undibacterium seohonense TaxID=1344950 RepID=A0ABR6X100_9BURK|nr:ABC transporter ATP-binding protein [Undibacterium seohonense]MBC3806039.1 ABC transporter ATP-binding protein [Undibacterium seohonense]